MTGSILRRLKLIGRSETGGAMVELAVVLPVLVLMAIGVMDYGRVFFRSIMVANAARAGADWGAYAKNYTNQAGMQAFTKLDAQEISNLKVSSQSFCLCGDATASCSSSCGSLPLRVLVEVTATDTVALLMNYPGLPNKIVVSQTARYRAQ
jgi:Flp pilus assembly protein TadG